MFLVAITKHAIAQNFNNMHFEELNTHPFIITIITDNIFAKYLPLEEGFSVIESPFFPKRKDEQIIFTQGFYHQKNRSFEINRSTISGRPIFYCINPQGEFYCSTHISLLRRAGIPIAEDPTTLPEFFIYRHIMPPRTLYKNIKRILIGGKLVVRLVSDKATIYSITYYSPPTENKHIKSIQESAAELQKHLIEILHRLQSVKQETTVLLSGGIDSSVISQIYKKILNLNNSYSTGYPFESGTNFEKRYAISAAETLEMNHEYYEPSTEEFLTGIVEAISYAEEPLHHLQSVLLHLLWKNKIPKEKRIILCAQGAGTTFGHNQILYLYQKRRQLLYRLSINNLSLSILKKLSNVTEKGRPFIEIIDKLHHDFPFTHPENPIWSWMDYGSWEWTQTYFKVTKDQIIKERDEIIKEFSQMSFYDIWSRYSLYGDEDVTLAIWSKIGEGNNKTIYYPYYDTNVLDYAFSIPWRLKLRKPRVLTKELAHQIQLPTFIINRPKHGFGITSLKWAKQGDVFEPLIPVVSKIFDEQEIRKVQNINNRRASQTFWNMVNYSIWKKICINNEPLEALLEELDFAI